MSKACIDKYKQLIISSKAVKYSIVIYYYIGTTKKSVYCKDAKAKRAIKLKNIKPVYFKGNNKKDTKEENTKEESTKKEGTKEESTKKESTKEENTRKEDTKEDNKKAK
jgi:hypothetical protein